MPLRKDVQEKKKRAGICYNDFWKIVSSDSVKNKGDGTYISTGAYNTGVSTQIRTIDPMLVEDPFAITKIEVTIKTHSLDNQLVIGMCECLYPIEDIPTRSSKLASSVVAFNIAEGLVHANSEHLFKCDPCTEGDVIKCVISSSSQCKLGEVVIEFYCNNLKITEIVCTEPDDGFFGLICLAGKDEEIMISPPEKEETQNCVDHFQTCTEFVEEEGDGVYQYVESSMRPDYSQTLAIGMIRSINAIDPGGLSGRLLVRLLSKGKEGAIAIGFCGLNYPIDCLPGWKDDSAALHVDINSVLYGSDQRETVSDISVGDVIECIVEPVDNGKKEVQVVFQNNGVILSKSKMWCPSSGICWSIGMMSIGEKIQIILPRKVNRIELPVARFEDVWHCPLFNVNHLKDGICVHTDSLRSTKVGSVRLKHPIDPLSPYPFFEVKIISCVISVSLGVGVCEKEYPFTEMPGLIGRSIGFNCNEGSIHQSSILPDATRGVCKPGDVIRCTVSAIDASPKRVQVSFSVNGDVVQTVFDWTPPGGFFAQVGFHPGNKIQIASPLMRPSVLRKGISNSDLEWKEFSLTLDVETGDVGTAEEYVNPPQQQQVQHGQGIKPLTQFIPILVNRQNYPCDHQLYQVLYNVKLTDSGIEHANDSDCTNGYVICRKQISEKLPYFEVEIVSDGAQGVAVGVCDGEVCVNECLGKYKNSVSFESSSGNLLCYGDHSESVVNVKTGDVIGCLIDGFWQKSNKSSDKNLHNDFHWKTYFFKNASLFGEMFVSCSMTYLYPTVCLMDPKACVQIRFSYGLSPYSYFDSHKIASGYLNFKMPIKGITIKWNCNEKCSLIADGSEVFLHATNNDSSLQKRAAVVQNDTPFTFNDCYFEAELLIPSHLFSTLSIGACPKLDGDYASIPGEVENSVGFAPLSGLIMRNKNIASYASDYTVHCTMSANEGLLVGVGIRPISSQSGGYCLFVFTVNRQEVAQIVHPIPLYGLYPTLAFTSSSQYVSKSSESKICKLSFSKSSISIGRQLTPLILPHGVARVSRNFSLFGSTYLIVNDTECTISAAQASTPISPSYSYFAATVVDGGANFSISIGLTTPAYSLDQLVGLHHPSIGYHLATGCLVHNSVSSVVSPKYNHVGMRVGCGVLFPEDGSRVNAEVYFTVDRIIVTRRLINIPLSGFYPSFAMHTESGVLDLHMTPCNPFTDLVFNTKWHLLRNVMYSDSRLQLLSTTGFGLAQLSHVVSTSKPSYTTVSLGKSWKSGKLLLGFSNCDECPLNSSVSEMNRSVYLDITSSAVIMIRNSHRQHDECSIEVSRNDSVYGFGVECHSHSHLAYVFFTLNNKVMYGCCFNLQDVQLRPSIWLMGTTGTLNVNACAGWPPETSIGAMWGRFRNVKTVDNHHLTFDSKGSKLSRIGFAQASSPLNHGWSYFEVEIVRRDPKKAIAVGLSSNDYDMSNWVGWKKDSIAYHADDGRLFFSSGLGANCGPILFAGDIIGCGVNLQSDTMLTTKVEVFFTVNRNLVGKPKLVSVPVGGLFPTVCVESPSEIINVIFYAKYPSSIDKMSRDWVRSICVVQVANRIEHQLKQIKSLSSRNVNVAFGYCQATFPRTIGQPYFEVEILEYDIIGNLSIGIAPLQQKNEMNIVTGSVLACGQGKVVVKQAINKFLTTSSPCQRFHAGDLIGCKLNYNPGDDHPETVSFSRNGVLMTSVQIPSELRSQLLHPTICFPNCLDSVIVYLSPPLPKQSLENLIGWIQTERIQINGRVVEYSGDSRGSVGAGQISSMLCQNNCFFEIEVLDLGEHSRLSIGAASVNYLLNYQPGWKPDSIGFHGDDGCLYIGSGRGCSFGPPWTVGDIIGFGVRPYEADAFPENEVQSFVTINGIEIGHTTINVPHGGLFPIVGFHSKNEKMKVDMNCKCGFATDVAKKIWRTLCGIQMKQCSFMSHTVVLQFLKMKRRVNEALPSCSTRTLGLAVAYQPFSLEMQYFEVKILNYGEESRIAIGVVSSSHSLDSILGWSKDSLAYHSHAGHLYRSSNEINYFGPVAHKGDKIGCGYVMDLCNPNICSIFFTLNGFTIGHSIKCPVPSGGYYPAIGLFSPEDEVSVVFSKSYHPSTPTDSSIVGLMRIHNCSYSDNILAFNGSGVKGPGNAHFAVPLTSARNYFSVSLLNINDNVVIGFVSKDFPVSNSPGNQSFSIAYDVLAGKVEFAVGNKRDALNIQKSGNGDIIGCSMVPSETKPAYFTVYFLVNQRIVCEFKISDEVSAVDWFPVIGFKPVKKSSHVYVNWNHSLFEPQNVL